LDNYHANLGWNSVCNLGSAERGAEPEAWNETRNDWNKIGLALVREVLSTTPNERITVYSVQPEGLIVYCVPLSESRGLSNCAGRRFVHGKLGCSIRVCV